MIKSKSEDELTIFEANIELLIKLTRELDTRLTNYMIPSPNGKKIIKDEINRIEGQSSKFVQSLKGYNFMVDMGVENLKNILNRLEI